MTYDLRAQNARVTQDLPWNCRYTRNLLLIEDEHQDEDQPNDKRCKDLGRTPRKSDTCEGQTNHSKSCAGNCDEISAMIEMNKSAKAKTVQYVQPIHPLQLLHDRSLRRADPQEEEHQDESDPRQRQVDIYRNINICLSDKKTGIQKSHLQEAF